MEIYTGLIMEYLIERATNINPKDDLEKLLKSKKNLRVKLGVDPTAPDVTLGWYAILRMLKKFQDYGHTAVLILGEFTAQVGDPSGKSETRKVMGENEIDDNAKGVLPIIKNILNENNLEIVSNKDWLSKLTIQDMMELASKTTLAQMMERDDFSKRFSDNSPISLLEFFYPLYQGYDSVAVKADIEIGGNDQLWNLMLGREIQKSYDLSPQIAMTFPQLNGTDGSSTNADDRILFDETFVDKIGLFNINTLGSGGQALKVNSAGSAFEFGSAGGLVKLSHSDFSGSSSVEFGDTLITDTYLTYLVETKLIFSANAGLQFQISPDNGVTNSYTTTFSYQHSRNDSSSSGGSKVTSSNYMTTGWSPGNQTGDVLLMTINLQNFRETTGYKWIKVHGNINAQGSDYTWEGGGELKLETKQNYFKIYPASGTMTGYATIYGFLK